MIEFITHSKSLATTVARAEAFARTLVPCLFSGEAGVGKRHLARCIHESGPRRDEPFVVLDTAASRNIEKELFGEMKRSLLMGASLVPGAIARAGGGTLLIKDVQLLPQPLQTQLSATIQLGAYKPARGEEPIRSNCRYLFSYPFGEEKFGKDERIIGELKDQFNRTTFNIPPLKDRPDDIEPLATHFLKKWSDNLDRVARVFTRQAVKLLKKSKWEGNAAALQETILRAVLHFRTVEIDACHLQMKIDGNYKGHAEAQLEETALEEVVEKKISQFMQRLGRYDVENLHSAIITRVERPLIKIAMEKAGGNQLKAARMLGINRNTLRAKLAKLALSS